MSKIRFDSFSSLRSFKGNSVRVTVELGEGQSSCILEGQLGVEPSGRALAVEGRGTALRVAFSDVDTFDFDGKLATTGTAELDEAIGVSFATITLRNGFKIQFAHGVSLPFSDVSS